MREVAVLGVGMVPFGRYDQAIEEPAQTAALAALDDAGVRPRDVQATFCGHVFQGRVAGQRVARDLGITGTKVINVENACASGSSAFHLAWQQVAFGAADLVLVLGFEKLSMLGRGVVPPDPNDLEGMVGRTNPATYALMAKRHMAQFGTTSKQLAAVSVSARRNGARNVRAQFRTEVSVEQVLSAPMIADPLTRLMCCPLGDGAAAAVIGTVDKARQSTTVPVRIRASVVVGGERRRANDPLISHRVTRTAARAAYEMAGLGPKDIDIVEVHDAFAIAQIVHLEDLGFCAPGDGGPLVESGATGIAGRLPVNPSGGLLAKGHPYGATGLGQIFEIVDQLRGRAGDRQVRNVRAGLAQNEGGVVHGLDAGVCAIHVLST
jgi:benzoylsuccinyl-CoA thiolase BbsB subunit